MKKEQKKISVHPRRLARQMAKAALDAEGVTGYNKEGVDVKGRRVPSRFARYWRKLTVEVAARKLKKKKGARK